MPKFKAEDIAHILSCTGRRVKKMLPDETVSSGVYHFAFIVPMQDRHPEIRKIYLCNSLKEMVATTNIYFLDVHLVNTWNV